MDENETVEITPEEIEPKAVEITPEEIEPKADEPSESAESLPCPDLTPSEDGQTEPAVEVDDGRAALEARIASLEAELAERDRRFAEREEFCRIFPDADPDDLPTEVISLVKSGVPMAAAYALHRHLRQLELSQALQDNKRNSRTVPAAVEGGDSEPYFSADTVRAMSRAEVKDNFSYILSSMKHWN